MELECNDCRSSAKELMADGNSRLSMTQVAGSAHHLSLETAAFPVHSYQTIPWAGKLWLLPH